MKTIELTMKDELKNVTVIRNIDISNAMVNDTQAAFGWEGQKIGTDAQIKNNLNEWIKERGNAQHDTLLTLLYYKII